ncbi:putative methyltransferase C9orf114 homolog isoform X1 [Cataglyphis hispanica]|uniref:putative methyltransferase C9orf114 homolog isoform X1 n=2 Tax=Cataglyphis hispanica TaxID=1086592 RepID=UPI00217FFBFF|nr:putative methyltransferase C9orf114 homolog isoform X1 [Cataglyphis hispanica]
MKHSLDCDTTNYYIIFFIRKNIILLCTIIWIVKNTRRLERDSRRRILCLTPLEIYRRNAILEISKPSRNLEVKPKEAYFNTGIDRNKTQNKNNCNWLSLLSKQRAFTRRLQKDSAGLEKKIMSAAKPELKNWKEYNRNRKELRKQWREEKLVKRTKKQELEKESKNESNEHVEGTKPERKDICTVSIAVPGSILDNAQSPELRTYLAGQIARAACIYKVDELIVFDDKGDVTESEKKKIRKDDALGEGRPGCLQLARILQYLECPQYLRKYFFPIHKDLQYAGVLNPLDAPHHLRQSDESLYREGIVTNKPIKIGKGSQVNVGLLNEIHVDKVLMPGLRVTVKIPEGQPNPKKLKGIIVPPNVPRTETGIYWGYTVKLVKHLTEVLTNCQYKGGYDLTIGTSDKGTSIDEIEARSLEYRHCLIVFGGIAGLEAAVDVDPNLDVDDPSLIFHKYVNTCPQQGSRTIRTEEAILLTLAELRTKLVSKEIIS